MSNDTSCTRLIGIIILARTLSLPLTKYEAMVERVEASPMFRQLWPEIISTTVFPRAQGIECAGDLVPNAIGQLQGDQAGFYMSYRHVRLAREYNIDEGKMRRWKQRHLLSGKDVANDIQFLVRQLWHINVRNRLTHMVLMGIAEHQRSYLSSGDVRHLKPLSQVALARWIREKSQANGCFLPPNSKIELVDSSMISRLIRDMSVMGLQGQEIPVRNLLPSTRDIHKRLIKAIIEEEKDLIRQGGARRAYTDKEIKERLRDQYGISISRRTVSVCRQELRIPSSYTRNSHRTYPPKLVCFSFYYPMNMASVKANAPELPGIYEISLVDMGIGYPLCSSEVVYIGSAKNLRKRLTDHLRPGSKNTDLKDLLNDHRAVFRYVVNPNGARTEEKRLCQCFIMAYGALPLCNRIRP